MTKAKLEKSAGAVVFRREDNEISYLILHSELGHWDFPKGNIEKGEELEETAKREIKEETGIKEIKFIEGFKEHIKYFFKRSPDKFKDVKKEENVFKIVSYLLAETKQREVKLSFEHIGYQWTPYKKALDLLTFQNSKEVLKKAHIFLTP
jgi:8-oxo-dGTP pyrophosphatase MutT (NUDIX family)